MEGEKKMTKTKAGLPNVPGQLEKTVELLNKPTQQRKRTSENNLWKSTRFSSTKKSGIITQENFLQKKRAQKKANKATVLIRTPS